ncbi:hypothetical protein PUR71_10015 [Streptomyces sp. SP17BM10]|uniref:hypothetical protein n=1 Tax=Streptomyces sp. SP17BM10 TaxID=3002530 RepID=UPI002E76EC09|nr:hypothetical protein [Streptomyces sp. SP17BM10]MEE1783246.1 hypothetical protein [Streptomyces sp. SP17BM10]
MAEIVVPGPEPDWQPATNPPYYTGRNPAAQTSLWETAASTFRMIAGLKAPLDALAARLRLSVERSWADLGAVDAAVFRVDRRRFALSLMPDGQSETWVWLHRSHEDVDDALRVLLDALGLGDDAVVFTGGPDTGFHYRDIGRPA